MMTILEEICSRKRHDLMARKEQMPPRELYRQVEAMMDKPRSIRSLSQALKLAQTGIIAEFKRKSPSKGWISREARPEVITPAYQQAGATALSILTDEPYFGGNNECLITARPLVSIPILRKDFIVDEYQVMEAKSIGADALLLIAACLSKQECRTLAHTAQQLGLETLLEIHNENELDYIGDNISVVGVNNRNLHLFRTDVQTSLNLADNIPNEFVKISESGIATAQDAKSLYHRGYNGLLIGERFMREDNPAQSLQQFIAALK
ncbi:MAG: indole-3-glycerol phosphate synthase TrpC [Bacteroidaceae bacterium]|nr:indole-3-glycerol phosphate synthase TrpC [Bacteroidaceae bacterium]